MFPPVFLQDVRMNLPDSEFPCTHYAWHSSERWLALLQTLHAVHCWHLMTSLDAHTATAKNDRKLSPLDKLTIPRNLCSPESHES